MSSLAPPTIRPAVDDDWPAMIALATAALGWRAEDPNAAFLRWKHRENPFGDSLAWVAESQGQLVGLRIFLRWQFVDSEGTVLRSVRAVDTATHPDHQGRGIFSALTLHALGEMRHEGIDFVFNTPNDQSRPGYLKMGWEVVGRVPVAARPSGVRGLYRMTRSRVPAEKWSSPSTIGDSPDAVFADDDAVASLLDSQPSASKLRTDRTPSFLRWRYGFEPLHYRVVLAGASVSDGVAVFRCRRRGPALEATIADIIVPADREPARRRLLSRVAGATGADFAIVTRSPGTRGAGFLPLAGQGPVLTWRAVCTDRRPEIGEWQLALADIELF